MTERNFRFVTIYDEVFELWAKNWSDAWHKIRHRTLYKRNHFKYTEEIV